VLVPLSNGSFGGIQALQNVEQCFPMQKNITMKLTNEQVNLKISYFIIPFFLFAKIRSFHSICFLINLTETESWFFLLNVKVMITVRGFLFFCFTYMHFLEV
jgi:hypothetical protein